MTRAFSHLTQNQRSQLAALRATKISLIKIAKILQVHTTTISRELARYTNAQGVYDPIAAHQQAQRKKSVSSGPYKLVGELKNRVISHLQEQWSPEQIAGRLRLEGIIMSHEAIYQFIWADKKTGGLLYKNLRHSGKTDKKRSGKNAGRGLIPGRIDISQRPQEVELKSRCGDWEGDTIVGSRHQGALLTLVDRHSKLTKMAHLSEKKAEPVLHHTCHLMQDLGVPVLSITFDNGKEFAAHQSISALLSTTCYFARPYHSWERGLNEHTNGLIRQYLPKKSSLKEISLAQIKFIEDRLNNRPRKALNYKTPNEVFFAFRDDAPVAIAG